MYLKEQVKCDRLVRQHHDAFVVLRRDISTAVLKVAMTWEDFFGEPKKIPGQMYCTDVRGVLSWSRMRREEAASAENGSAGTLTTNQGRGLSVMLMDEKGMPFGRVRKTPATVLSDRGRLVVHPTKEQREAARKVAEKAASEADAALEEAAIIEQLSFGGEFDHLDRKPPAYDWFVLWTLSRDALQVPEVFLAAVHGIDDPATIVILASTPLPRGVLAQEVPSDDEDFEEYRKRGEETGPPSS